MHWFVRTFFRLNSIGDFGPGGEAPGGGVRFLRHRANSSGSLASRKALGLILAALASGGVAGCAGAASQLKLSVAPVDAWGLAVYPVVFHGGNVSSYHAYAWGRRTAEQVSGLTGRLVYGPGEFAVINPEVDDITEGTDVLRTVPFGSMTRPSGLAGLRLTIERRRSEGSVEVDGRKRDAESSSNALEIIVRADLLSGATGRSVSSVEETLTLSPSDDGPQLLVSPMVEKIAVRLTEALVKGSELQRVKGAERHGFDVVDVPGPAVAFAFNGRPSMAETLTSLGEAERKARLDALAREADPEAGDDRRQRLSSAEVGLLVRQASGAALAAGVQPDDLLVAADGLRLTGQYVLQRAVVDGRARLSVLRGNQSLTLPFDAAAVPAPTPAKAPPPPLAPTPAVAEKPDPEVPAKAQTEALSTAGGQPAPAPPVPSPSEAIPVEAIVPAPAAEAVVAPVVPPTAAVEPAPSTVPAATAPETWTAPAAEAVTLQPSEAPAAAPVVESAATEAASPVPAPPEQAPTSAVTTTPQPGATTAQPAKAGAGKSGKATPTKSRTPPKAP